MSTIRIFGNLELEEIKLFEKRVRSINFNNGHSKELFIRIKSDGGNSAVLNGISKEFFDLSKKGIKIIGQAELVGSTAMLIYLNCHGRWVTKKSEGYFHLPEPNTKVSEEICSKMINSTIEFIERRTNLSKKTIYSLNNVPLDHKDMVKLGIATKLVENFK